GRDGAVHEPHAEVGQVQLGGAVLADLDEAEVDLAGRGLYFRRLQGLRRELGQELVEAAIDVGELGGLLGGHGQIDAPHAAEERTEKPLLEQRYGGRPVLLAGESELIEVAAGQAVGEDELVGKESGAGIEGSAAPARESGAVMITVGCLGRINARTLRTDQ